MQGRDLLILLREDTRGAARSARAGRGARAGAARRGARRRLHAPPVRERREPVLERAAAGGLPARRRRRRRRRRRGRALRGAGRHPRRRHQPGRADRRARGSCSTPRATWTRSARSTSTARRVRVGPGVVQEDLNRAVARHGLGFGPDTSTSNRATLGGMIGNNSSGSHSIVYGTTIDHVHELDVVLADGSTARFGPVDEAERARRARGRHARGRDLPRAAGDPARPRPRDRRGLPASTGASPAATGSTASRASSTSPSSSPARRARWWRSPRRRSA